MGPFPLEIVLSGAELSKILIIFANITKINLGSTRIAAKLEKIDVRRYLCTAEMKLAGNESCD